ncbi:MAG TPA: hypothetical protein VFN67_37085 [Polyangiales bacterium]|nr:hypothetical protein [Polyangiales bacterium]
MERQIGVGAAAVTAADSCKWSAESKAFFVGSGCKLCGKAAELEFGAKGLE